MPFPFAAGSFDVSLSDPGQAGTLIDAVEAALRHEKAKKMTRSAAEITFRGGLFRMADGHNILGPISSGRIRFLANGNHVRIEYRIIFFEMFILMTLMIMVPAWFVRAPWYYFPLGWLWVVGGNYAIALFRFPRFLRRTAATAVDTSA